MRTENTPETLSTELPKVSPAEIARIVEDAQRMRAETQAALLRSAGRGIARLVRALVTRLATPRPIQRGMKNA
jgi:hypothetical protein